MQEGRFAIWVPGTMGQDEVELVARDAAGREVGRQTLSKAGEEPVLVPLTPDANDPDGVVDGAATPAP